MEVQVQAAAVAGAVALLGALLSGWYNQRSLRENRSKLERELQRRFTERLIELRLRLYPQAFEITEPLAREALFRKTFGPQDAAGVHQHLTAWNRAEAPLVVSQDTLHSFRRLRDLLRTASLGPDPVPESMCKEIWTAKNAFRSCLRRDVQHLYEEDEDINPSNDARRSLMLPHSSVTQTRAGGKEALVRGYQRIYAFLQRGVTG
jgi:hypothetical protein